MIPGSDSFLDNASEALKNDAQAQRRDILAAFAPLIRTAAVESFPEFDTLREHVKRVRQHTLDHLDFYRLAKETELEDLGLEEVLVGSGVCVIEWPDDFFSMIGPDRVEVSIEVLEQNRRLLTIVWRGAIAETVGTKLRQIFS